MGVGNVSMGVEAGRVGSAIGGMTASRVGAGTGGTCTNAETLPSIVFGPTFLCPGILVKSCI